LAYVCQELAVQHKTSSGGIENFKRVMDGDPEAQDKMEQYCRNDVAITEQLFNRVKTYIRVLPNEVFSVRANRSYPA
jgi:hypothetical protein